MLKSGFDHCFFKRQIMVPRKILKPQQHMLQIKKAQDVLVLIKSILNNMKDLGKQKLYL